jgi:hypothetical protein
MPTRLLLRRSTDAVFMCLCVSLCLSVCVCQVRPWVNLFFLTMVFLLAMGIGLLPYIDNFMHIGGFIGGLLAGMDAPYAPPRPPPPPCAHGRTSSPFVTRTAHWLFLIRRC